MLPNIDTTHKMDILISKYGFKEIAIEDKSLYSKYETAISISDLTFANLFCWRRIQKIIFKEIDGFLCTIYINEENKIKFYPLLGDYDDNNLYRVIDVLADLCIIFHMELAFACVEEWQLPFYKSYKEAKVCGYDDASSDYIYASEEFMSVESSKNKNRRAQLNHLSSRCNVRFESLTSNHNLECKVIVKKWCKAHQCENCFLGCEALVINECLDNFEELGLIGGILYIDDQAVSFVTAVEAKGEYIFYLFQKSSLRLKGITEHLYLNFSKKHAKDRNINFSEDLGIESLKQYKQQLCNFTKANKFFIEFSD